MIQYKRGAAEVDKICLLIIFNHRYDRNLHVLRQIYNGRFSNIYFLVPGYNEKDIDVIPVYNCSYYFQGYFPQAYNRLKEYDFSHYIFIADDMMLNPELNERNIINRLNLEDDAAFTTEICTLESRGLGWGHIPGIVQTMDSDLKKSHPYNASIKEYMLPQEEAEKKIKNSMEYENLTARSILKRMNMNAVFNLFRYGNKVFLNSFFKSLFHNEPMIRYPLVYGYSDFVIVPKRGIEEFCYYCGLFAIKNLFVEVAIPTALALTQERLITMKDVEFEGGAFWGEEAISLEKRCNFNIESLWKTVGSNKLYIHPVKLSKWGI